MSKEEEQKKVKLLGKVFIAGEMKAETGLKVGTASSGLEVGGVENLVIRDALTGRPYLPGSTLKGKMRSLLTRRLGLPLKVVVSGPPPIHIHRCEGEGEYLKDGKACPICRIFGLAAEHGIEQTRLFVRDGVLKPEVEIEAEDDQGELRVQCVPWKDLRTKMVMPYTEVKWEAVIDVVTSAATPRPMERVPAGALFSLDMVFDIYDSDDLNEYLKMVFEGLMLIQDDYLGGSGSRGYGKVSFKNLEVKWQSVENYADPKKCPIPLIKNAKPKDILEKWSSIIKDIRIEGSS